MRVYYAAAWLMCSYLIAGCSSRFWEMVWAIRHEHSWTPQLVVIAVAGLLLTAGPWYFLLRQMRNIGRLGHRAKVGREPDDLIRFGLC